MMLIFIYVLKLGDFVICIFFFYDNQKRYILQGGYRFMYGVNF